MVKFKNMLDELIYLQKNIYKIKFMQIFETCTEKQFDFLRFIYLYVIKMDTKSTHQTHNYWFQRKDR